MGDAGGERRGGGYFCLILRHWNGVECCALCPQHEEWVGGTSQGRLYWWPKGGKGESGKAR